MTQRPRPEDVAQALRDGVPPSALLADPTDGAPPPDDRPGEARPEPPAAGEVDPEPPAAGEASPQPCAREASREPDENRPDESGPHENRPHQGRPHESGHGGRR